MKVAAAYVRVSTDMQVEYSPDSQLRLIRDYAKAHDFVIPDEYIYMELGVSGKRADKRPAFQKMISQAKNKEFDSILIYHTNRFARNHEESIVYKSMLKRDCGIDVISITQPPVDKKTDMLTNAIYSVMDEWYSIDLSANVKRGMTEKAMRGGYQCSPPYGYFIPGYKQPPAIVEEEAKVVRKIFDMYLNETKSLWRIGKKLTEMGCLTRKGNPWERRAVEYIIKNPVYKGVTVWNKRNNNKSINDSSDWIIAEGSHEAIVEPAMFDKVQEMLAANKARPKAKPAGSYKHWLSGVLKCSSCGRGLTYSRGKYGYFGCNGYKKGVCGDCNSISRLKAEAAIEAILNKVSQNIYPVSLDQIAHQSNDNAYKIELLTDQLIKAEKKLRRFKEAYSAGYDTLEEYGANKANILNETEEIKNKIKALEKAWVNENSHEQIIENVKTVHEKLKCEGLTVEEKSLLLQSVINKMVYNKGLGTFEVFFNF